MGIRHSLIYGFAVAIGLSVAAQARDFEMGGYSDYPYSIMAPERGAAPRHHRKVPVKKQHVTVPHPQALTKSIRTAIFLSPAARPVRCCRRRCRGANLFRRKAAAG